MKRVFAFAALLAWIGGLFLMCDPDTPDARRLALLIPPTAGPWLSEADQVFDPASIFGYIDGAGEVYRSYNMKLLVARRFHKDGKPDIVVDLFDMGTSADAFGVFTHDLDGEDAGVGHGSNYKAGLLSAWKDRYFISVYAEEETPETKGLVLELGRRIAAAIPAQGEKPTLFLFLPPDGLNAARVRYFHNHDVLNYHFFVADANILLLDQGTDAVLADYGDKDDRSRLLVVRYADAAAAAKAQASFVRTYMPDAPIKRIVETAKGRWTAVRVEGRYATVVFDVASDKAAEARLAAVVALIQAGR
jgi:hypothetical protein